MANAADLNEFIQYLEDQANFMVINGHTWGEPYVIGGQHLSLTPSNYETVIHNREHGRGGYSNGQTYEEAAKQYCERLFDAGATQLYAYDCSGLGMYFWQNVKHEYPGDMNAHGMMGKCNLYKETPKRGWWVFHVNNGRATHIGYMVDNTHVIESKGRRYGVTKSVFRRSAWDRWGIPKILEGVIPAPGDPRPGTTQHHYYQNYIFYPGGGYFFPPH